MISFWVVPKCSFTLNFFCATITNKIHKLDKMLNNIWVAKYNRPLIFHLLPPIGCLPLLSGQNHSFKILVEPQFFCKVLLDQNMNAFWKYCPLNIKSGLIEAILQCVWGSLNIENHQVDVAFSNSYKNKTWLTCLRAKKKMFHLSGTLYWPRLWRGSKWMAGRGYFVLK